MKNFEKNVENSYVVRCGVRYAYGISLTLIFCNKLLEKQSEKSEISSGSPNCTDSLRNYTVSGSFKCSNYFGCST